MRKMRKLATIRKVKDILPIENADFIELAKIDGWQCVVKKGMFKKDDLCVFFEIDSFIPLEERYEFLRKSSYRINNDGDEGFKLRTVKLRGQISQGLLLPLDVFPEIDLPIKSGDNVTELLKVKLYEPPIPAELDGEVKGNFPFGIPKSNQERIQNLTEYFQEYKNIEFEMTEKLDGSSCTIYHNNGDFGVCARKWDLIESENNAFWRLARNINIEEVLENIGLNIAIQGELVGEGIQKNPYKLEGLFLYVYNIWDIEKRRFLKPKERMLMFSKIRDEINHESFNHVPFLEFNIKVFERFSNIQDLLNFSTGKSLINKDHKREGLVFKSCENDVSFKVINNIYLLKKKD
jgi:RNA ligase (TIGR02306 family)